MASYLFVSAVQPTISELAVCTAAELLHLCVTSPSPTARATEAGAKNDHWVFTVDEPLLAARERHEIRADVMARYAQGAARESRPTTLARPSRCATKSRSLATRSSRWTSLGYC